MQGMKVFHVAPQTYHTAVGMTRSRHEASLLRFDDKEVGWPLTALLT